MFGLEASIDIGRKVYQGLELWQGESCMVGYCFASEVSHHAGFSGTGTRELPVHHEQHDASGSDQRLWVCGFTSSARNCLTINKVS